MKFTKQSIVYISLLVIGIVKGQNIEQKSINISVGLGISMHNETYENIEYTLTNGFYAQGEYVIGLKKWFELRPYAGFITTSESESNFTNKELPRYYAKTTSFFLGPKARIIAPIPYVAPYIESGYGLSIGSFETYDVDKNIKKNGVVGHIPFSIGLMLGKNKNFDVGFTYQFQKSVNQVNGAFAIGYSFELD